MAKQQMKPSSKTKASPNTARGKQGSGLPGFQDFFTHPQWTQDVYWSVIRKALLAVGLGAAGLVTGYCRLRLGDAVGAGLSWAGLSLVGSWLLKPSEAEFEFLGRYNHFILHPPHITQAQDVAATRPGGKGGVGGRLASER